MKYDKNKLPFYYKTWFISLLILITPFTYLITGIVAIVLLSSRNDKYPNLTPAEKEKISAMEQAKNIISSAKQEASDLVSSERQRLSDEKNTWENKIKELKKQQKELATYIAENSDIALRESTTVDFTDNITSNEIKNELVLIQTSEKEMIKNNTAVVNQSSEKKAIADKQARQLLRAFNAEADYYTSNVTVKNVDTYRNRLTKAFETINKLFEIDRVGISKEYLTSKLKQLDVMYKYQRQIEVEKELLKAQKEEIKEQQKVEKEIQDAKRKLEKEEQQFQNEMTKLLKYLNGANSDVEQQIYADKIKELEEKIKLLEKDKEDVLKRESNTRAGFVYIISNIGSFGENVYKIGMTRRLEPMDRINELGSASVPFPFDVHALIFSEDAPALENTLHNYFRSKEMNKVNPRKEFFKVELSEIKELVHKEFNNTVHFTDLAVAEQYRETLKLESNS
ncbi:TPA: DUF4041 domain-containing protein [Streptococcus suis]|nr:DUF4041 domain-containing protein [Streptococcus suis]NQJ65141.1 DUF4041 domain-containing protein [Streptococcus suis]HEL2551259.1 DUF4041 domain-containing protein [Streptococcus suis]